MPRHSKKSQYTEKEKRFIYILRSPLTKEFFIGHCKNTLIKDVFKQHYRGDRPHTRSCFQQLKAQGFRPCLFILEEVESTKVEAYHHVIAWTKIFSELGYTSLNQGNITNYIDDMFEDAFAIYQANKDINLKDICNCETCIVSNYARKKCPIYEGD